MTKSLVPREAFKRYVFTRDGKTTDPTERSWLEDMGQYGHGKVAGCRLKP